MKECKHLITLFPKGQNLSVIEQFDKQGYSSISGGGNFSSRAFLLADMMREINDAHKVLWLCSDDQQKDHVLRNLGIWGDTAVHDFDYQDNPLKNRDIEAANRVHVMEMLALIHDKDRPAFLVMKYSDLFRMYPSMAEVRERLKVIKQGDDMDTVDFFEELIDMGYQVSLDAYVEKGQYFRHGDVLTIWPVNLEFPVRMQLGFDEVESMAVFDQVEKKELAALKQVEVYPLKIKNWNTEFLSYFGKGTVVIDDEVEFPDMDREPFDKAMDARDPQSRYLEFRSFMEESSYHHHLHYLSVIKYSNPADFATDMRDKMSSDWTVFIFSKHADSYHELMKDRNINYVEWSKDLKVQPRQVVLIDVEKDGVFPEGFQNPSLKFMILSDRNIAGMDGDEAKKSSSDKVQLDFLTGLKAGDYVVHSDHGIGQFMGLDKRTVDDVTREYLKIAYAANDKLFVPIDQAHKVSKYIGAGDKAPKLTRLGSAEWSTMQNKVRQETEKIAQELLQLYAERHAANGHKYKDDTAEMKAFEKAFPYEATPGQHRAILDVKRDMERAQPMDRLVCGDVGFGKTEVSMRAAFKAVQDGKQVAVVAPITILVDQHYKSYCKRMEDFNVRVAMMSRFRTPAQQRDTLAKLERGEVDIVIGTHRLLQADVKFKNLGLVVIDEEQRFGVKQKEKLKDMRKEVDILTLTATPIPRTMNIALHGLRDISTITTPPPGRLPIVTEVRRFSLGLIKQVIERELERNGQVYFLHNRVQTIEDMAQKLRELMPKARFVVTHGKLKPDELEKRIMAFKNGEFDVLVSSTIIENGIDLSSANTLIVNQAEKFGLAQLYQLRGRVGRSKIQAYSYFLYHMKRLPLDAKKRLRAIVEATELGAGFQVAMKDLEIRGAGDVLGANQSGALNVVGVSHFIRMLNQAVEDLKRGKKLKKGEVVPDVTIEVPLPAYIPDEYIVSAKEKIAVYQKLAAADTYKYLSELRASLVEDYGKMPEEVANLFRVLEVKMAAKNAGISNVKAENVHSNKDRQIVLTMTEAVKPPNIMNLLDTNGKWIISGTKLKIAFDELGLNWVEELKKNLSALAKQLKNLPGAEVSE